MTSSDRASAGADVDAADLRLVDEIGARDDYLAVVTTLRADGRPQASVANAGVIPHPLTGNAVVAFVTFGRTKLHNLRRPPDLTLTWRAGWQWVSVDGVAQLVGPDDSLRALSSEHLPGLLRLVFTAAGGQHPDWRDYDRVMAEQGRVAVLVAPRSVYTNPTVPASGT